VTYGVVDRIGLLITGLVINDQASLRKLDLRITDIVLCTTFDVCLCVV
jgi:hypothetical protein